MCFLVAFDADEHTIERFFRIQSLSIETYILMQNNVFVIEMQWQLVWAIKRNGNGCAHFIYSLMLHTIPCSFSLCLNENFPFYFIIFFFCYRWMEWCVLCVYQTNYLNRSCVEKAEVHIICLLQYHFFYVIYLCIHHEMVYSMPNELTVCTHFMRLIQFKRLHHVKRKQTLSMNMQKKILSLFLYRDERADDLSHITVMRPIAMKMAFWLAKCVEMVSLKNVQIFFFSIQRKTSHYIKSKLMLKFKQHETYVIAMS